MGIARTIFLATAVAGTLDILSAFAFGAIAGRSPSAVLLSVAAGPFGARASQMGALGPILGLAVHFFIMMLMVAAFAVAVRTVPEITRHPMVAGLAYGLVLYGIMYWIVLPARWPSVFPQTGLWDVGNALFSHLVCVGFPIGIMVSSGAGVSGAARSAGSA